MAEISPVPDAAAGAPPPATGSSEAQSSIRKTKPGTKRLILTLTVLFSFLAGAPFLLKSTEIYRSPLPLAAINSLSTSLESTPLSFPFRFQVVFIGFGEEINPVDARNVEVSVLDQVRTRVADGSNFTVSVAFESGKSCLPIHNGGSPCSWRCESVDFASLLQKIPDDDKAVDDILNGALSCPDSGKKIYTVVVVHRKQVEKIRVVVGKYRHFWISGINEVADAVPVISRVFVEVFVKGRVMKDKGEFMPVGADGNVVLSFNLLNSNPNDWVFNWDFKKVEKTLLVPVVEALAPIVNVSVESQVLYHTPKSSFSQYDKDLASYVFSTQDLPFFVNSNEWHLDTSIAAAGRSKILQFVVYIPSATECPLLLRLSNGEVSLTNGFISPMWGGVIVWNPPSCLKDRNPGKHEFSPEELQKLLQVFIGQLRMLFGLKSDNHFEAADVVTSFLASEKGFSEWELDALFRHHTSFNLRSCASTLGSLSRLVLSLPRMIVTDEIGRQVKLSLEAATLSHSNASFGLYDASAASSRRARTLSEDAFFHPSIMSLSYSSIEHYLAIYMPFFAPVSLHVLIAAIKEIKRYRKEKAKYLAWLTQKKVS